MKCTWLMSEWVLSNYVLIGIDYLERIEISQYLRDKN